MAESSNRAALVAVIVIAAIIAGVYFMNAKEKGTTVATEATQSIQGGAAVVADGAEKVADKAAGAAETGAAKVENAVDNNTSN